MHSRRIGVLVAVLLAGLGVFWFSQSTPAPPPPGEPPPSPSPSPSSEPERPPAVPPPLLPAPAPVQEPSAEEAPAKPGPNKISATYYLREGNKVFEPSPSTSPFPVVCEREALACATNEIFWVSPPPGAMFTLRREGDRTIVTASNLWSSVNPRFGECLERSMRQAQLSEIEAGKYACMFSGLKRAINDGAGLSRRMAACLGPVTSARSVTVSWDFVVEGETVETQNIEVSAEGDLDGYAARCIEQAASAPAVHFSEEQRPHFTRQRASVTVVAHNTGAAPAPRDNTRLPPPLPRLSDAPLTNAQRLLGERELQDIRAAMGEARYDLALGLCASCVADAPRFAPCYRYYGWAAAKVAAREGLPGLMKRAREAYQRYLETAEPGDESIEKVRAILATDAGE